MTHLRVFAITLILFSTLLSNAQSRISRRDYIDTYKLLAIKKMHQSGIPASITMAQACLESDNGNSKLAREANNHFGIKCKKDWNGARAFHNDDHLNECFRKYDKVEESYDDHTIFLLQNQRYAFLFKISNTDYESWAKGLKTAGYATDPEYANRLIKIINEEQLHLLDRIKPEDLPIVEQLAINDHSANSNDHRKKTHKSFGNMSVNPFVQRETKTINGIEAIFTTEGDTYEAIAQEFELKEWEIYSYNDLPKDSPQPIPGTLVYLNRKNLRGAKGYDKHVVATKESMWSISQKYGIKLNRLYKLNRMKSDEIPVVGNTLNLRNKIERVKQSK